eukprot:15316792-Alexandrium_andersonii.AAC.1
MASIKSGFATVALQKSSPAKVRSDGRGPHCRSLVLCPRPCRSLVLPQSGPTLELQPICPRAG